MQDYQIPKTSSTGKKITWLIIGLVLLLGVIFAIYYQVKINRPFSQDQSQINFAIAKGTSTRQIAENLKEENLIGNTNVFIAYIYLNHASSKIQAGNYVLSPSLSVAEIVDIITAGKVVNNKRSVTILEGWNNVQIGNFLANRGIVKTGEAFQKILTETEVDFKFNDLAKKYKYQGFLFPDTYTLNDENTVPDLISKMLNNFESKVTDQMVKDANKNNYDFGQRLILASIIEEEVGRNKSKITDQDLKDMQRERELVASVFYNRLEIGMALESDATVNYVTGKADRSVSIEDTKIKSLYNTYQNRGLPPTPISNPGIGSIKAAIYPANTDYVYFLNAPDGTAYFAKTLAEHNANKAKYLK